MQRAEDVRERLGWGLLQRQDPNVEVVEAQVTSVALERRVCGVMVHEGVAREPDGAGFILVVVEQPSEEGKRLAFREHARLERVLELCDKRFNLLHKVLPKA